MLRTALQNFSLFNFPSMDQDTPATTSGITNFANAKRKVRTAVRLWDRIQAHKEWLETDVGKEWRQRQLMQAEDKVSKDYQAVYLWEKWYDEMQPDLNESASHGRVINFGKHKGDTFSSVFLQDKKYCDWVLSIPLSTIKNPAFKEFAEYLADQSFFLKKE